MTLLIVVAALVAYAVLGLFVAVPHMVRRGVENRLNRWDREAWRARRDQPPFNRFRREAAAWWPLMCLAWGPWAIAQGLMFVAVSGWDTVTVLAAGRSRPTGVERELREREQAARIAEQQARIHQLEKSLGIGGDAG